MSRAAKKGGSAKSDGATKKGATRASADKKAAAAKTTVKKTAPKKTAAQKKAAARKKAAPTKAAPTKSAAARAAASKKAAPARRSGLGAGLGDQVGAAAKPRRGLGRGLDALIRDEPIPTPRSGVQEVPVADLTPNRFQPRSVFDESGLEDLAESIRAQGVIQPIVVRSADGGGYTIIAGERRWRAAQRAGLERVPVVVRTVSGDQELLELALVENLQRADLNPVEEAEAYRALADGFSLSQEEIGRRVGRGRSTVTNALRLLRLPEEVQDMLRDGRLSPGHARPLLALDSEEDRIALAQEAVEKELTARQLEERVREPEPRPRRSAPEPDVHTQAAAETLTRRLQTRVEIRRRGQRGTMRVHFHSEEELMRLYDLLMDRSTEPPPTPPASDDEGAS